MTKKEPEGYVYEVFFNKKSTDNFSKVSKSVFFVKNQNGFNAALYYYFNDVYSKKTIRSMVKNYPETYPTFIVVKDMTFECSSIFIEAFTIFDIIEAIDTASDLGL